MQFDIQGSGPNRTHCGLTPHNNNTYAHCRKPKKGFELPPDSRPGEKEITRPRDRRAPSIVLDSYIRFPCSWRFNGRSTAEAVSFGRHGRATLLSATREYVCSVCGIGATCLPWQQSSRGCATNLRLWRVPCSSLQRQGNNGVHNGAKSSAESR